MQVKPKVSRIAVLIFVAAMLLSACSSTAQQIRSVSVDTNGLLLAPTNFFTANAATFVGALGGSAGRCGVDGRGRGRALKGRNSCRL